MGKQMLKWVAEISAPGSMRVTSMKMYTALQFYSGMIIPKYRSFSSLGKIMFGRDKLFLHLSKAINFGSLPLKFSSSIF